MLHKALGRTRAVSPFLRVLSQCNVGSQLGFRIGHKDQGYPRTREYGKVKNVGKE